MIKLTFEASDFEQLLGNIQAFIKAGKAGSETRGLLPPAPAPVATTPATPPAPAHDFLQGPSSAATGLPVPQVAPPMPQQLPPKYSVQGQLYTREQLLAAGWTDAQISTLTSQ